MKKIAVIAGDSRMVSLSMALADLSYDVNTIGLERSPLISKLNSKDSIFETVDGADAVVLPVPLSKDGIYIFSPLSKEKIKISDVMQCVDENTMVFVPKIIDEIKPYGHRLINYMKDEALIIENARLTAEGTLCELITESASSLKDKKILVIGNGNVGKQVSRLLRDFGAAVTVSARKPADFAIISTGKMNAAHTEKLAKIIGNFEFIINTVPAPVLTEKQLKKVKKDAVIFDLASSPGGTDFEYAEKMNLNAKLLSGLPGKHMPKTAGRILANTVLRIMGEEARCKI